MSLHRPGASQLFVGAVGAITRIHQDNHHAHAWLCNLRGRKLYVLCSPADSSKVAPARSLSKAHGTKYEGRLDPLDPLHQERARSQGLTLYATVLEPGQTIIAPDGWWHYAVSLTPTITLMCNFWDSINMYGLEEMVYDQISRALDSARRDSSSDAPHVSTRPDAVPRMLSPPVTYLAINRPWIYLRAEPSTRAPSLGILRPGQEFVAGVECDGWVRSAEPVEKGKYGWALLDGKPLKLGPLMAEKALVLQARQQMVQQQAQQQQQEGAAG